MKFFAIFLGGFTSMEINIYHWNMSSNKCKTTFIQWLFVSFISMDFFFWWKEHSYLLEIRNRTGFLILRFDSLLERENSLWASTADVPLGSLFDIEILLGHFTLLVLCPCKNNENQIPQSILCSMKKIDTFYVCICVSFVWWYTYNLLVYTLPMCYNIREK